MHKTRLVAAAAALAWSFAPLAPADLVAQSRVERVPYTIALAGSNRAVLGVMLASPTRSDTIGVRIDDVNPDGPAAKAGIKEGMVITAVNGVSLRVSAEDAADSQTMGLAQRRLTRTLQGLKPGDEVELRVQDGRDSRTIRVKTVAASELNAAPLRASTAVGSASGNRAALGISIGVTGNPRDTLGLFVNSVVSGGPAEKAGVIEGDRIAAINGVDLRVPREDVEDMPARMSRVTRFNRELQKANAGDRVTLRVWNGSQYRDVAVMSVKASELPNSGFFMRMGDGAAAFSVPELRVLGGDGDDIIGRFNGNLRMELSPAERERMNKAMEELRVRLQELPSRIRTVQPLMRSRVWQL